MSWSVTIQKLCNGVTNEPKVGKFWRLERGPGWGSVGPLSRNHNGANVLDWTGLDWTGLLAVLQAHFGKVPLVLRLLSNFYFYFFRILTIFCQTCERKMPKLVYPNMKVSRQCTHPAVLFDPLQLPFYLFIYLFI